MKKSPRSPRSALLGLLGAGASLFAAAPAHASLINASPLLGGCAAVATSQPFTAWGDTNSYKMVAGSDFASGSTNWTLAGGASLVATGEPFGVTPSGQAGALNLPAGASAVSPLTCVDLTDPSWRFFDAQSTGSATLQVSVNYTTPIGLTQSIPVGIVSPSAGWQPSPILQTGAALQSIISGGSANVALSFTELTGTSQIDAVFIDPRMRY